MSTSPRYAARDLVQIDRTLVIAHRGDSLIAPENTILAFNVAIGRGVDFVELDFHRAADGVLVVIHDDTLDRTTNARSVWGGDKIAISSRTAAELCSLDAGSWFEAPLRDGAFSTLTIPTLETALRAITSQACAAIERKSGDASTTVELLQRLGVANRVVLQAFDWEYLAECHRLAPHLTLAALGDSEITTERLDALPATGASVVGWDEARLTAESARAIHDRGLRIWAWTVDDPARMRELADWGVDGLVSNNPGALRRVLSRESA